MLRVIPHVDDEVTSLFTNIEADVYKWASARGIKNLVDIHIAIWPAVGYCQLQGRIRLIGGGDNPGRRVTIFLPPVVKSLPIASQERIARRSRAFILSLLRAKVIAERRELFSPRRWCTLVEECAFLAPAVTLPEAA